MCGVPFFLCRAKKVGPLGLVVWRLLGVWGSCVAYLSAEILHVKENNKRNQCQKTLNLPPLSSLHARGQISGIHLDPLVSSESQMCVFLSLKMKRRVNFRGCEWLRSSSIRGQLMHRMVPVQDDQEDLTSRSFLKLVWNIWGRLN